MKSFTFLAILCLIDFALVSGGFFRWGTKTVTKYEAVTNTVYNTLTSTKTIYSTKKSEVTRMITATSVVSATITDISTVTSTKTMTNHHTKTSFEVKTVSVTTTSSQLITPTAAAMIIGQGVLCVSGYEPNGDDCVKCGTGFYKSLAGNSSCVKCPDGAECTTTDFTCEAGYEISGDKCDKCGEGSFKTSEGNFACSICPEGAICSSIGFSCNIGFQLVGDKCVSCPETRYKPYIGNGTCIVCPEGSDCQAAGFLCSAGRYLKQEKCITCAQGTFKSDSGNQTCEACPELSQCSSTGFTCIAGYEKFSETCAPCKSGYFKKGISDEKCTFCPANSECSSTGYLCAAGFEPFGLGDQCSICKEGTYKKSIGNEACGICPKNGTCTYNSLKCEDRFVEVDGSCVKEVNDSTSNDLGVNDSVAGGSVSAAVSAVLVVSLLAIAGVVMYRKSSKDYGFKHQLARAFSSSMVLFRESFASKPDETPVIVSDKTEDLEIDRHNSILTTLASNSELSVPVFLKQKNLLDFKLLGKVAKGGGAVINDCSPKSRDLFLKAGKSQLVFKNIAPNLDAATNRRKNAFYQEVGVMWRLRQNPHFIDLVGYSEEPMGIIMNKYPHGDLYNFIRGKSTLNDELNYSKIVIIEIMQQCAKAIQFMHSQQMAHCDIKPANVLLDYDHQRGKPLIIFIDFGITRILDESGGVFGFEISEINGASLAYSAPEALSRMRKHTKEQNGSILKAGDVYSLSMSYMEVLQRRTPWI